MTETSRPGGDFGKWRELTSPVLPQLARVPVQTGRWPALPAAEAEQFPEQGEARKREELGRWYRLDLPEGADVEEALAALGEMAEVEAAEPNYVWSMADEIPPVIEGLPDGTTDPAYDEQWFHENVWIWKAWNRLNHNGIYPGGTQDVVVAVIDSGVDYNHEELKANMWVNPGEIPGNGIDDDGNGFKDDIHGASVVSNPALHSGDPIDYHGHGTHVAGIIAAQGFNGKGGVGVAFNVRIMAIRAAQYSGVLTVDDIAEGILYAVDNGADVINMSFGGYARSQIVEDALEIALNQAVLVAAAGNDSLPKSIAPHYPAALPYVLGVQASTTKNKTAAFSNSGYEIMAPGVSIHSTLPGNQYAKWSGTSMAAPVVSGVAALMRSYFWQRDIYSSRFIMGSIAASGSVVDAFTALTKLPAPGVRLHNTWLFDSPTIAPANDGDGRADAGETIHIGFELINRSGQADHVIAILDAYAPGASQSVPYVEILSNTVIMCGMGPFSLDDNGLIYNADGVITGDPGRHRRRTRRDVPGAVVGSQRGDHFRLCGPGDHHQQRSPHASHRGRGISGRPGGRHRVLVPRASLASCRGHRQRGLEHQRWDRYGRRGLSRCDRRLDVPAGPDRANDCGRSPGGYGQRIRRVLHRHAVQPRVRCDRRWRGAGNRAGRRQPVAGHHGRVAARR